jgi:hypothetical protein
MNRVFSIRKTVHALELSYMLFLLPVISVNYIILSCYQFSLTLNALFMIAASADSFTILFINNHCDYRYQSQLRSLANCGNDFELSII